MSGTSFYLEIDLMARLHVAAQHPLASGLTMLHKIGNAVLSKTLQRN